MSKETGILFKESMVKGILSGQKTMTRRLINPQPDDDGLARHTELKRWEDTCAKIYPCRYGHTGDFLYVRETFFAYGYWVLLDGKWKFYDVTAESDFMYRFYDNEPQRVKKNRNDGIGWYKRPALFMPKAAARIWLEITGVKCERVCDISEQDAIAEGVYSYRDFYQTLQYLDYKSKDVNGEFKGRPNGPAKNAKHSFETLWSIINGPETWNHWCFAITFKEILFK